MHINRGACPFLAEELAKKNRVGRLPEEQDRPILAVGRRVCLQDPRVIEPLQDFEFPDGRLVDDFPGERCRLARNQVDPRHTAGRFQGHVPRLPVLVNAERAIELEFLKHEVTDAPGLPGRADAGLLHCLGECLDPRPVDHLLVELPQARTFPTTDRSHDAGRVGVFLRQT